MQWNIRKDKTCECADRGCPAHFNRSTCRQYAHVLLYRIDMEDQTGTAMCYNCAEDANTSGLFR
jgi:hypothetical protein